MYISPHAALIRNLGVAIFNEGKLRNIRVFLMQ